MSTGRRNLEWAGFLLMAACLGVVQFSIAIAQILFTFAVIILLVLWRRERKRPRTPAFFLPLMAYAALTLVSATMSGDRLESLRDCKQLLMFLTVPLVARFARGNRAGQVVNVVIALGAAGAIVGIVQYAMLGYDQLNHRPAGTLS